MVGQKRFIFYNLNLDINQPVISLILYPFYSSADVNGRQEKGRKLSTVGDLADFHRQEKGRKLSIIGEQFEFKMHGNI
jgi:hypothetical protein